MDDNEKNKDDEIIDEELVSIYKEEVEEINEVLQENLSKWKEDLNNRIYIDALKRDLHTMKGGARMIKQTKISELIHEFEAFFDKIPKEITFDLVEFSTEVTDFIYDMVDCLGNNDLPDTEDILLQIKNYPFETLEEKEEPKTDDIVDEELVSIYKEEVEEINEVLQENLSKWKEDLNNRIYIDALKRDLHTMKGGARMIKQTKISELIHEFEAFFDKLPKEIDEDLIDFCSAITDFIYDLVKMIGDKNSPDPDILIKKLRNFSIEDSDVSQEKEKEEGIDNFLLGVFLDEAEQTMKNSLTALEYWNENRDTLKHVEKIRRLLHTIKSGAKMINQNSLSSLIHELEGFYKCFLDKEIKINDEIIRFLVDVHYFINNFLDAVRKNEVLPNVGPLIEVLNKYVSSKVVKIDDNVVGVNNFKEDIPFEVKKSIEVKKNEEPLKKVSQSFARIDTRLLERLDDLSIESNLSRVSLEHSLSSIKNKIFDMDIIIDKINEQMKTISSSIFENNIKKRKFIKEINNINSNSMFDELEMDEYSEIHQLTLDAIEVIGDLRQFSSSMLSKSNVMDSSLLMQFRIGREIQDALSSVRLVSFSSIVPRLQRIVRQVSSELKKKVNFEVLHSGGTVDKNLLEKVIPSLEHLVRNALDHGIEDKDTRKILGKKEEGKLEISLKREGQNMVISLSDDGGGINKESILAKVKKMNLIDNVDDLTESKIFSFLLMPGFSTKEKVTEISGRGVGLDVVSTEIKELGGTLDIQSKKDKGTSFFIKVPFSFSMNKSLIFEISNRNYAIPLHNINAIVKIKQEEAEKYLNKKEKYIHLGEEYKIKYLGDFFGISHEHLLQHKSRCSILLFNSKGNNHGFIVDKLNFSREIIIQSLGTHFTTMTKCAGAALLGDGSVVFIVEPVYLIKLLENESEEDKVVVEDNVSKLKQIKVMIVDDSVTVRKVTSKLLTAKGFEVMTAKDGLDAIQRIDVKPDIFLLDLEMPRMDGFEFTSYVRGDKELKNIPIIMITSRTGEKHRTHALRKGVTKFLGKPYQEDELISSIYECLEIEKE